MKNSGKKPVAFQEKERTGSFTDIPVNSLVEQEKPLKHAIQVSEGNALEKQPTNLMPEENQLQAKRLYALVMRLLMLVKEPDPEKWSYSIKQRAVRVQDRPLGWLPVLVVTHALGVLVTAYGCVVAMHTSTDQQGLLWLGCCVLFVPSFFRLLSPIASRMERMMTICSAGFCIFLLPELLSPLNFFFVDEYMHLRTIDDIVQSAHLFHPNSMLPVSPVYPGLEIVTDALSTLSGLSTVVSGLIVVGVARIIVMLTIFVLFEQMTKSPRIASIAAMIYMTNASFFLFDSLFVYESLGLALGLIVLFVLYRVESFQEGRKRFVGIVCVVLLALTVTHHVSDLFFVGLLVLWVIVRQLLSRRAVRSWVTFVALVGCLFSAAWIFSVARPVIGYLSSPIVASFEQVQQVLSGTTKARHLFVDHTNGHPTPLWEQLAMLLSIGLITLGIPFAFVCLWHRYRHKAFPFLLALVSLLYPCVQVLRVASESANIPDRSSPYIFVAVGFALATLITQIWPVQRLKWKKSLLITLMVTMIFLGGGLLGSGPTWRLMPSGYLVGDDARSIDLESVQAARWMPDHVGSNNRVFTNGTNALLMGSYGDQHSISMPADGVDIAPVFYAPQFHSWETSILQSARVRYLIVDLRISMALPAKGYYFDGDEEPDINVTTPISKQAITKFNTVPGMNRIFDSGNIVIYDVGGLVDASQKS